MSGVASEHWVVEYPFRNPARTGPSTPVPPLVGDGTSASRSNAVQGEKIGNLNKPAELEYRVKTTGSFQVPALVTKIRKLST